MASRRDVYRFDWSRNDRTHWIILADEFQHPLKIKRLEPGSDLLGAFLEEALQVHRDGWRIGELTTSRGWFLAHRGVHVLLRVNITDMDPTAKRR